MYLAPTAVPPGRPAVSTSQPLEESDWSSTAPAFVGAMKAMTSEALLECLAGLNVPAAKELEVERQEGWALQAATRKALAGAAIQGRTNEGRRTFQTILTAVAHDEDGPSRVSIKRKAEILGVHPDHVAAAHQRAQSLQTELSPSAAMDQNAYWFHPRAKRSDVTPPEF